MYAYIFLQQSYILHQHAMGMAGLQAIVTPLYVQLQTLCSNLVINYYWPVFKIIIF